MDTGDTQEIFPCIFSSIDILSEVRKPYEYILFSLGVMISHIVTGFWSDSAI